MGSLLRSCAIEQLWPLGDLNLISRRPFFVFVLTASERLWAEVGGVIRPTAKSLRILLL